jgi:acylglycerol lipase
MEARHEQGRFAGVGGLEIHWQAWLPANSPRAVVLIAHGAAEHGGRYAWTAAQLTRAGYAAYAIDHRGHGRSAGPRAYVDRVDNVVADLHTLAAVACAAHPGAPTFLLGHSMGGLIALAYALRHQRELAGLALSAPLAVLEAGGLARVAARTLSAVAPRLPVYRIDGTTVSRDPAVVQAYDDDPLNYRGKLPARTIGELAATVAELPGRLPELRLPILVVYGSGDRLVDPAGSELVGELAGSDDVTVIRYDGLFHEVLNEPERGQVAADLIGWIDARTPAHATAGG